jgi:hypothetical protein
VVLTVKELLFNDGSVLQAVFCLFLGLSSFFMRLIEFFSLLALLDLIFKDYKSDYFSEVKKLED